MLHFAAGVCDRLLRNRRVSGRHAFGGLYGGGSRKDFFARIFIPVPGIINAAELLAGPNRRMLVGLIQRDYGNRRTGHGGQSGIAVRVDIQQLVQVL